MGILRNRKRAGAPTRERGRYDIEPRSDSGPHLAPITYDAAIMLPLAYVELGQAQAEYVKATMPSFGRQLKQLVAGWDVSETGRQVRLAKERVASVDHWYTAAGVSTDSLHYAADQARVVAFRDAMGRALPDRATAEAQFAGATADVDSCSRDFEDHGWFDSPHSYRLEHARGRLEVAGLVLEAVSVDD